MTKSSIITTCRRPASGVIPFSDFRGVKRLDVVVGSSVDQPTGVDDVHAETSGGFPLQLARNGGLLRYHRARVVTSKVTRAIAYTELNYSS